MLLKRYYRMFSEMYAACRKVYKKHTVRYVTWEERKAKYMRA